MADAVAGGKSQLVSPRHDVEKASTHSASGWKYCEQKRGNWRVEMHAKRSTVWGPQARSNCPKISGSRRQSWWRISDTRDK